MSTISSNDIKHQPGTQARDQEHWQMIFDELKQQRRFDEAQQWVMQRFGENLSDVDSGLLQAQYLNEVRRVNESYLIYEQLLRQDFSESQIAKVRLTYARRLLGHGLAKRAWHVIRVANAGPNVDRSIISHSRKIENLCELIERLEQRVLEEDENTRILAFKHAIMHFANRTIDPTPSDRVGRLTLVTGSLGGGGAERQISRLAIELTRLYQQQKSLDGLLVDQPVDLVLRSLNPASRNDFFLPEVLEAGCSVHEMDAMPARKDLRELTDNEDLRQLLQHQPSHVAYGLSRLVDYFRKTRPDCVAIWQDGACMYTVLAALLAGVPKIQIGLRGLPPVLRRHLLRPEYEPMYQALDHVPGIDFLANSGSVAHAYAKWLDLPLNKFHIVYNGVTPPLTQDDESGESLWQSFVQSTPDARRTIGGVFRFATDKRPNHWIRFAQQCLARHSDCRFLIVGAGDLMPDAREFAAKLGILDRLLFVGATKNVGFWMDKMDVMVLLSQFEGLPNVLIEAQLKSLPVVSTPAGGAGECFVDGISGVCLDAIEPLNFQKAVEAAVDMADRSSEDLFNPSVKDFLENNFSVATMMTRFVHALRAPVPFYLIRSANDAQNSSQLHTADVLG